MERREAKEDSAVRSIIWRARNADPFDGYLAIARNEHSLARLGGAGLASWSRGNAAEGQPGQSRRPGVALRTWWTAHRPAERVVAAPEKRQ